MVWLGCVSRIINFSFLFQIDHLLRLLSLGFIRKQEKLSNNAEWLKMPMICNIRECTIKINLSDRLKGRESYTELVYVIIIFVGKQVQHDTSSTLTQPVSTHKLSLFSGDQHFYVWQSFYNFRLPKGHFKKRLSLEHCKLYLGSNHREKL